MIGMGASRAARCQCCAALRWSRAPWTLASVGVGRLLVVASRCWGVGRGACTLFRCVRAQPLQLHVGDHLADSG